MDTRCLKVGICQLRQGYDFAANLSRAIDSIALAAARGAEVVVLPEMFVTPYEPDAIRASAAMTPRAIGAMQQAARDHGIHIVAGSLPVESGTRRYYNRALVFDPQGQECFHHDKLHLFDCRAPGGSGVTESLTILPGSEIGSFAAPWGISAVAVCYDIRFTPLMQLYAGMGVRVLFVPAAFALITGKAHWQMLVRMRAIELQAFVVGVQPARNDELGYVPWGHSLVASPWGETVCSLDDAESVALAEIDLAEIDRIRADFPLLAHRRDDLYRTVRVDRRP